MSGNEENAPSSFRSKATATSRGRNATPRSGSKLAGLEASVSAAAAAPPPSSLLARATSRARSSSRAKSAAPAPKKEKTEAEKAAAAAVSAAKREKELAPLKVLFLEVTGNSKIVPTMTNLKEYETLMAAVKGMTPRAAVEAILGIKPRKKTGRTEAEKAVNASIMAMLKKSKLGRSSARLRNLYKNAKAKNATRKNNSIIEELAALERSPEKEKSEKELEEEELKEEVEEELEALVAPGKKVNSLHVSQLFRLRNAGFNITAADYLALKDMLKDASKLSKAQAAEANKMLGGLVKQKKDKDVCQQCELLKVFGI